MFKNAYQDEDEDEDGPLPRPEPPQDTPHGLHYTQNKRI